MCHCRHVCVSVCMDRISGRTKPSCGTLCTNQNMCDSIHPNALWSPLSRSEPRTVLTSSRPFFACLSLSLSLSLCRCSSCRHSSFMLYTFSCWKKIFAKSNWPHPTIAIWIPKRPFKIFVVDAPIICKCTNPSRNRRDRPSKLLTADNSLSRTFGATFPSRWCISS